MAALDDALEAIAKLAKRASRFDSAFEAELRAANAVHARSVTFNQTKMKAILEREVAETNRVNAGVDPRNTVANMEAEARQLEQEAAVSEEVSRRVGISDPSADMDFRHQSNGPEEYTGRMVQLRNSEFVAKAVGGGFTPKDIDHGLAIDEAFQQIVKQSRRDPRTEQAIKEVVGDTPYKSLDGTPQVMVHIDTFTDPVRAKTDEFIQQLDEAYEIGVHSGTNQAALKATIGDPDAARLRIADFDQEIVELDALADMDGVLKKKFATTLDEYFYQKFARGEDALRDPALFDDFKAYATTALQRLGIEGDEAASELTRFVNRMKQLPTANSTAHYFNGQNGLLMKDVGGWKPSAVLEQLADDIFPEFKEALDVEFSAAVGQAAKTRVLRQFIEDRGYDHIVYHNTVEDVGSLSVIHWQPEQMIPIMDARVTGGTAQGNARAATSYIMGGVFGGTAIRDKE